MAEVVKVCGFCERPIRNPANHMTCAGEWMQRRMERGAQAPAEPRREDRKAAAHG